MCDFLRVTAATCVRSELSLAPDISFVLIGQCDYFAFATRIFVKLDTVRVQARSELRVHLTVGVCLPPFSWVKLSEPKFSWNVIYVLERMTSCTRCLYLCEKGNWFTAGDKFYVNFRNKVLMEHFSWLFQLKLLIGCAWFLLNSPFISDDCFTNRFRFSDHKSIMHEAGEVVIRFDREAKEGGGG